MELFEAIYHRRTVRHYTAQMVPAELLTELIDVAVQAPSAMNLQPWAFAVFRGVERLRNYSSRAKAYYLVTMPVDFGLDPRGDRLRDPAVNIFHDAGTLLVICAKSGEPYGTEDCCLAAQTLMLAAYGLGLGTAAIGLARPWLDLPDIKDELGIPGSCKVVFPLTVGYAAETPRPVSRWRPEILSWQDEDVLQNAACPI